MDQNTPLTVENATEVLTKVVKEIVPDLVKNEVKEEVKSQKNIEAAKAQNSYKQVGFLQGKAVDTAKYKKSIQFVNGLISGNYKMLEDLGFKTLNEDSDTAGGFLVPEEFSNMIDEIPLNVGFARRLGQIVPMKSKTRNMPVLENDVSVYWPGEGNNGTASDFSIGNVRLDAKTLMGLTSITNELLDDSDVDMLAFIAKRFAQAFALEEDRQLFVGNGAPFVGALNDSRINVVQMAGSTFASVTVGNLRDMIAAPEETILPGCAFFMHKSTLATIQKLQENSQSIVQTWNPIVDGTIAGGLLQPQCKIWGYPVFTTSRLPSSTASGTRFVLFGNFNYFYFGDRRKKTMKVSDNAVVGSYNSFTANGAVARITESIAMNIALPAAFTALRTA